MTTRNPNNLTKGEKVVKAGSPTVGTIVYVTAWGLARVLWEGGAVTFPQLRDLERVKELPPWGTAVPVPHVQVEAFLTKFSRRGTLGSWHGPEERPWNNPEHDVAGDLRDAINGTGDFAPRDTNEEPQDNPMAGRAWTPGMEIGNGIMNQINKECDAERTPQRAATNAMLAAGVVPAHLAHGTPPPELSSPSWEQPGHPVYELAKRIFIIDNAKLDRAAAAKDWDTINPLYRDYAFNIARGLLDEGWQHAPKPHPQAVEVAAAWNNPGPVPEAHRLAQELLRHDWPVLAGAVERLAGAAADWQRNYGPPPGF